MKPSPPTITEPGLAATTEKGIVQRGDRLPECQVVRLSSALPVEGDIHCPAGFGNPLFKPDAPPGVAGISPSGGTTGKMDSSESPTQSNDGRSYDQYFPPSSQRDRSAHLAEDAAHPVATFNTQSTHSDQRSLADDDTGAVVFNLEHPSSAFPDTQFVADASPLVDVGSLTRKRTFARSEQTSQLDDLPPETPAVSKNPFAGKAGFQQLVPTSQLFKATQYSSAYRGGSPTSSRPSPNDFLHNSISPNLISSPLKARGLRSSPTAGALSSPQGLQARDEQATPLPSYAQDRVECEPRYGITQTRAMPEPVGVYVPMRKSQERRSSSVVQSDALSEELTDDEDDPIERRRRAQARKKASLERLTSIHFSRTPKPEKVEVPSTNTRKEKKKRTAAEKYLDQCYGTNLEDDAQVETQPMEMVADSQGRPKASSKPPVPEEEVLTQSTQGELMAPPDGTVMRSSTVSAPSRIRGGRKTPGLRTKSTDSSLANRETIPETSPVEKQRASYFETPKATPGVPSNALAPGASCNPALMPSSAVEEASGAPASSMTDFVPRIIPSVESEMHNVTPRPSPPMKDSRLDEDQARSSQALPAILPELTAQDVDCFPSSPPVPANPTTNKKRSHDAFLEPRAPTVSPITEPPTIERVQPTGSASSLSSLASTPVVSPTSTAPATAGSAATGPRTRDDAESPVVAKNKRRRGNDGLPRLPVLNPTESLRMSARLSRQRSVSTDELARSPSSTPTFEQSVRLTSRMPAARLSRTSTRDLQSARELSTNIDGHKKLFAGMAFAVSFQAKKHGENAEQQAERVEFAKSLERRIVQAGGRLLSGGFHELFRAPPVKSAGSSPVSSASSSASTDEEVTLDSSARNLGFTALIADGHSRKVKYMEALALGLPCLAPRWITTCLDRGEIVDWAPYLLCAGQSKLLGDAYRSRNLAPYDPLTARLSEIVEARTQLLKDDRILLVMKKSDNVRKGPYVFLARVLGATVCRVHNLEGARGRLKQMEALRQPFDWVYVDDKFDKGELFDTDVHRGTTSKRRKSRSAKEAAAADQGAAEPPTKIRTLSDELVIQSLILGRLIEEGEMEE